MTGATGFWDSPLPRVLAHRGLFRDVPENSLAAFRAALDQGIEYLEADVRATRDGVAVLAHDESLLRLSGHSALISELSWSDLTLLVGKDQQVPRLDEVLVALPEGRFNLDIKHRTAAAALVNAVQAAGAQHRVLLTSFSRARRQAAADYLPRVALGASPGEIIVGLLSGIIGLAALSRRILRNIGAVQIPVRVAGVNLSSARVIRLFHRAQVEVHFWTINDASEMHRLLDAGADGIITDRTDLAAAVLAERAAR